MNRRTLASMLAGGRGPSTVDVERFDDRLAALTEPAVAMTDEARNRAIRHSLARRLLDDPVVYYAHLTEAERAYLASQRVFLLRRLAEAAGLVAEARAEGIALADLGGDVTDLRMPDEGTEGHATLLIADYLVRRGQPVPLAELAAEVAGYAARFRSYWRKTATEPGGELALTRTAVDRLVGLWLVQIRDGAVAPLPALSRYRYAAPAIPEVMA